MTSSKSAPVSKNGGPTSSTTIGDSQCLGTSIQDAMEVDVVQATPNLGGGGQLVHCSESSDNGDSQLDKGSGGCGDGDGKIGGASSIISSGGGTSACGVHSVAANDGNGRTSSAAAVVTSAEGTTSNGVAAVTSIEGTGEGVTESSTSRPENQSGGGLESLPPLERARRQFIDLAKAGDNVHAGLIHGNLNELIEKMKKKPLSKGVLKIPLCRMIHMPMVRPTLRCDVIKLMGAFRYGYKSNSAPIYVSLNNDEGEDRLVSQEIMDQWNPCWRVENEAFEQRLQSDPDLECLSGSMFFVYDGNHRLLAWKEVIETLHADDQQWYSKNGNPECVILDTAGGRGDILSAMHNINS